jgi:translation initiation factor IF-1
VAKEEGMRLEGKVIETLPNAMWRVQIETGNVILAYLGGKLRKHTINIGLSDRVVVEMSPYDLTRGRIVYRL